MALCRVGWAHRKFEYAACGFDQLRLLIADEFGCDERAGGVVESFNVG